MSLEPFYFLYMFLVFCSNKFTVMYSWSYSDIIDVYTPFCQGVYDNVSKYYGSFFIASLNTGCRPIELLDVQNWTRLSENTFEAITVKGSNPRIINSDQLTSEIIETIDLGPINLGSYSRISRQTCERMFADYFNPIHWYFFDDPIKASQGLYIFRHIFIKKLYAEGKSVSEIAEIIGEVNAANVLGYLNSMAYSPASPPL
jgi:hypothetical protein